MDEIVLNRKKNNIYTNFTQASLSFLAFGALKKVTISLTKQETQLSHPKQNTVIDEIKS